MSAKPRRPAGDNTHQQLIARRRVARRLAAIGVLPRAAVAAAAARGAAVRALRAAAPAGARADAGPGGCRLPRRLRGRGGAARGRRRRP